MYTSTPLSTAQQRFGQQLGKGTAAGLRGSRLNKICTSSLQGCSEGKARLQPLLPAIGARIAADVLWSSAKLGLDPDALVPGMTDSLAQQFMADMDAANGQEFANVLVACGKLQLNPC